MTNKYVHEYGDGPYVTGLTGRLRSAVETLLDQAEIYRLLGSFIPAKTCAIYLYSAAAELVLRADGKLGIRQLYTKVGELFGKSMETARRCMDYSKLLFDYPVCNDCLFDGQLSRKAFGYVTTPEFVARICETIIQRAEQSLSA